MGRRRRRGKVAEELTLEGFAASDLQPSEPDPPGTPGDTPGEDAGGEAFREPSAAEPSSRTGDPPPLEAPGEADGAREPESPGPDPASAEEEVVVGPAASGPEEGAASPSLSAPSGEPDPAEDLPRDGGVVQRSVPSGGGEAGAIRGPDLAVSSTLAGDPPPDAPMDSSPPPDPAGTTSETPVQEARVVPIPPSSREPAPALERDRGLFSDLEEARALQREGRIHLSMDLLRAMVESDPRNVEARVELGTLLDRTGAHAAAVEHLEAAHRAVPDSVQILSALGAALTSLGRFDEAERELKRAQRLAPEDLLVRANLAIVSFRRGLYGHAEAELRWICERDEGNATAHFYRGEALNRLGRVDEALDAMKTVTRLDPSNARAFYTMGILYDKKHLPSEAAAMYRKARELGPR